MSFGWSASDVAVLVKFLYTVGAALKESGGAAEKYQEDSLYLTNVCLTLEKVVTATGSGPLGGTLDQRVGNILDKIRNMRSRLEKYKSSLPLAVSRHGITFFFKRNSRKVQYTLFVLGEVQELRSRIAQEVQGIQLELGLSIYVSTSQVGTQVSSLSTHLSNGVSSLSTKFDQQNSQSTATRKQDVFRKTLAWLNPVMGFEDKHRTCLRDGLEGSCDWIFSKQAYIEWYQHVNAAHPTLLWVTAIPEAGKTTVASRVIETLIRNHLVAYFYCETRTERSRTTVGVLCTLSWQILRHDPNLVGELEDTYSLGAEPYLGGMEKALQKLIQAKPDTLIILDGLDECDSATQRNLCGVLTKLTEIASVLVFSRDVIEINEGLTKNHAVQRLLRLEMVESDTEVEIKRFIVREMEHFPEIDEESKRRISASLQKRAQGMFLWADLMIKQLRKGWFDVEDCLEAIDQAPSDLQELYRHIMQNIHSEQVSKNGDSPR